MYHDHLNLGKRKGKELSDIKLYIAVKVSHGLMVIAVGFESTGSRGPAFKPRSWNFLSIACDVKLKGALYSVFYAEASKGHP